VSLRDLLLVLMLGLPAPYHEHEDADSRRTRLAIVAQAISDASTQASCSDPHAAAECQKIWPGKPLDLALLLVTEAYWESRLARNVHEGRCRDFECDPYRSSQTGRIEHRARTLWQMQYTRPIDSEWGHMVGADLGSTRTAAWAAAKLLGSAYRACGSIPGAISRISGNGRCVWSGADRRALLFEQLRLQAGRLTGTGHDREAKRTGKTRDGRPLSRSARP
jgi:hypothetical protein